MSPLVTETNLTLCPFAAHMAATPPAWSSQSSGWAPKQMMRILPSRAVAGSAAVSKHVELEISRVPRAAVNQENDEYFIRGLSIFSVPTNFGFGAITRTARLNRQNKTGGQGGQAQAPLKNGAGRV